MRAVAVAVGVAAALLGAWIFLRENPPGTSRDASRPAARSPGSNADRASGAPLETPPSTTSRGAGESLPPPVDTRAEDRAACRLAMELLRCTTVARSNLLAAREARADDPKCATLPAEVPPWKLLLQAAGHGHVPSMTQFANGNAIGIRSSLALWDVEAVAEYREHAYAFLVRAAEAGDGAAVARLARELLAPGLGTRAVPYDPVRGLAYAKVLARHADGDWRERIEGIILADREPTPISLADRARAEALSRTILPAAAEAKLEQWSPLRESADAGWGCDG